MINNRILWNFWQTVFAEHGYKFFSNTPYDVNVFSIRAKERIPNKFNDLINVAYLNTRKKPLIRSSEITTLPGSPSMKVPPNESGVAILVPGQYRGAYCIRKHNNKYLSMCQRRPQDIPDSRWPGTVAVYRDNNRNQVYDMSPLTIQNGHFGINIHYSSREPFGQNVNRWSAGCSVYRNQADHAADLSVIQYSVRTLRKNNPNYKGEITYTLFLEEDLEEIIERKYPALLPI